MLGFKEWLKEYKHIIFTNEKSFEIITLYYKEWLNYIGLK